MINIGRINILEIYTNRTNWMFPRTTVDDNAVVSMPHKKKRRSGSPPGANIMKSVQTILNMTR